MDSNAPQGPVTQLLRRWSDGDVAARDALIPLVYEELRRLAGYFLAGQRSSHTLQSTALVHEAYLRLTDRDRVQLNDRAHFFATAAQLMRRILVDHARKRNAAKRGTPDACICVDKEISVSGNTDIDVLSLDRALVQLARMDPRQYQIVEMRFFGGLSIDETATVLQISPATVKREWSTARAWLSAELRPEAR